MMQSGFAIAVSSEVMAILAMAKDLDDMRQRWAASLSLTTSAATPLPLRTRRRRGDDRLDGGSDQPEPDADLGRAAHLCPCGPFANIAVGQSSIIADRVALKLSDYVLTESGFAADIGFEKFWNIKCRESGLTPHCAVIVATIRALKCHGGAPLPLPGQPLDPAYNEEQLEWVEAGCENLIHHVNTVKKAGINPVVCINAFHTDTDNEIGWFAALPKSGGRVALSSTGRRR